MKRSRRPKRSSSGLVSLGLVLIGVVGAVTITPVSIGDASRLNDAITWGWVPLFRAASPQEIEVGGYSMDGVSPGSSRKTRCTTPSSSCRPTWTKPFATTTFIEATLCSAT